MEMVSPHHPVPAGPPRAAKGEGRTSSSGRSPTCVMAAASDHWESKSKEGRSESVMDSITPPSLAAAYNTIASSKTTGAPWSGGQGPVIGKGNMFGVMRGAHESYQHKTESDASNARHKANLSLALKKTRPTLPESTRSTDVKKEGTSLMAGVSMAMEVMEKKMRGQMDGLIAVSTGAQVRPAEERSTNQHKTATMHTPRDIHPGVRASAFGLISQQEQKRRDNASFRTPNEAEWMTSSVPVPDLPLLSQRQSHRNESDSDQEGLDVPDGPVCTECNEW